MSTERKRIQSLVSLLSRFPAEPGDRRFVADVGAADLDDCTVLPFTEELDLIVGSDFVRGEGFSLFKEGILGWRDVGGYLVAANASDLAAMGATPFGLLSVVRYHQEMSDDDFEAVSQGIVRACQEFQLPLLGGDTGSYESSVLSATALGVCARGRALRRSAAKAEDSVYLSDATGIAGAALAYFTEGKRRRKLSSGAERLLMDSWRRVRPELALGQRLVDERLSACATDTSDGLKAACRQVAEASAVDIVVDTGSVVVHDVVHEVARALNVDALAMALSDSVDFRLMFTVTEAAQASAEFKQLRRDYPRLHPIGHVAAKSGEIGQCALQEGTRRRELPGVEWEQGEVASIDRLIVAAS